ncbi:HD domain-containing protein [Solirubrobacter phytolaccae]|uniref:HD domain-containing protein n=1 Tax=Solirubrobacter phytolaccae TaxID=1404360 RepID=A0A9X3N5I1_9ACTN|nr:HD domain-containing phosphohydrolase [Solirubrobacter phytolaccae]MDA0179836.1 HD domain-containing protein [Solirubrobacter phytolaccae]
MPEPRAHLHRISRYCALLAEPLGLDPELVRGASWLHDIGMAGLHFARRPGPLSVLERRALERHPERGAVLLRASGSELLDLAAVIALTHHERFDGDGYPQRLGGEQIPLVGRIVAVADAYDALTTDRPYRLAIHPEGAVAALHHERGRQFDPAVLDAFLERLDAVEAIRARHPSPPPQLITPEEAGALLGWSPSKLRRAANSGRLPVTRTSGGHRRFVLETILELVRTAGAPEVRPLDPPTVALPQLARLLDELGPALCAHAAGVVYGDGPPGWFASRGATPTLVAWLEALAHACATGVYAPVHAATRALMTQAEAHTATLLERHAFLERFGQLLARALHGRGETAELADARRLIAALQQRLLAER